MENSASTSGTPGLVVRSPLSNASTKSVSATAGASSAGTAGTAAAAKGLSLPMIIGAVAAISVVSIALGVGLGVGLQDKGSSAGSSSPVSTLPADVPLQLSLQTYSNVLTAPPAGAGGLCSVSLMSGDVSATTAVVHVLVRDPLGEACTGNGTNSAGAATVYAAPDGWQGALGSEPLSMPLSLSSDSGWASAVVFTGLQPATRYTYSVLLPGGPASAHLPIAGSVRGAFRTLAGAGYNGGVAFLHMSCANRPPYPISPALAHEVGSNSGASGASGPGFIIFNGDTVYADRFWLPNSPAPVPTLSYYRSLYADQRDGAYAGAGFPYALSSAAVYSGWDDHEVINNYSGNDDRNGTVIQQSGTGGFGPQRAPGSEVVPNATVELLKQAGYTTFFEMMPLPPPAVLEVVDPLPPTAPPLSHPQHRLFRKYRPSAHVEVFHLDLRQYRDTEPYTASPAPVLPSGVTADMLRAAFPIAGALIRDPDPLLDTVPMSPSRQRSMLGQAQRQWLYDGLRASNATWKVIVSEYMILQWFMGPHDRWEGYAWERNSLLQLIESEGIAGVVFLTGDVHAAIFSRVNPGRTPPVYEFTTGPVGASSLGSTLSGFGPLIAEFSGFLNTYAGNAHVHGDGVRFAALTASNYMRVEADADHFRVIVRDGTGRVLQDDRGRYGVFTLPEDGDSLKGFLGSSGSSSGSGSGSGSRRALREEREEQAPPLLSDQQRQAGAAVTSRLLQGFQASGKLLKHQRV